MAETIYQYTISIDFPAAKVASDRLIEEIQASAIITSLERIDTDTGADNCDVVFMNSLSAPDKTVLDGLVVAHLGVPLKQVRGVTFTATNESGNATTVDVLVPLDVADPSISSLEAVSPYEFAASVITITQSGQYLISLEASVEVGALGLSTTLAEIFLERDTGGGFSVFTGSRSRATLSGLALNDANTTHTTMVRQLTAGDRLRMGLRRVGGDASVRTVGVQARLTIVKL